MKGLNVKRIAAIGLGAALVGSALAPVVSAANMVPTGLDEFGRGTVITASGAPAVDVVVGANAAVSDVVWAGNIAARVAQLATKPVTCTAESGTVDLTVGGTTSLSGSGEVAESVFDFSNQEAALNAIQVTNTQMPSLTNNPSTRIKWDSTSYTTTSMSEDLNAKIDAAYNSTTGSSRYAVGEVYGSVAKQSIFYNVNLGSGIDVSADLTGMDANSRFDVKIPFLGKTYVLDEIDASEERLVLYSNTNPTDLKTGETITVTPASDYEGKEMIVELVDLVQTGSGTATATYEAKWALKIDGTVVKYVQKAPATAYNLKEEFGQGYFSDDIYVTAAGLNLAANTYTATIRSGTDRIELRNGYGFPYTGTNSVDQDAEWKVLMDISAGTLTQISLTNQWKYDKVTGSETETSKYVLKVGEEIVLPNDFAKLKFMGFNEEPMKDVQVGAVDGINNGGIKYYDAKGTEINVPFYVQFDLDSNKPRTVTIGSQEYTFWTDFAAAGDLEYIKGDYSSAESQTGASWISAGPYTSKTMLAGPINIDLGAKNSVGGTVNTEYQFVVDTVSEQAALVLDAQTFDIYDKAKSGALATLRFVDTNNDGAAGVTYYVPNTQEFMDVIASVSMPTYDSDVYMASRLIYVDNNGDNPVELFVRAGEDASVWDYESIKEEDTIYGPTKDAISANWTSAIRDGSDYLLEGITEDGSLIVSDNSVFTISVPEEARLVQAYLGSVNATESVSGGSSYTGVAQGETKGNVTVTAVNCGGSGASAVEVVPISDMVKTSKGAGKSIIVGGWFANPAADVEVAPGQTLRSLLINDGDYVSAVLPSGDVLVAGKNASDTGRAASDLIAKLDAALSE